MRTIKKGDTKKRLCKYCKEYYCPPTCPNFFKPSKIPSGLIGLCFKCGKRIFRGEAFQFKNNEFFCGRCASLTHLAIRFS